MMRTNNIPKNKDSHRVLVLERMEGKPLSNVGAVDDTLFTGGNKLNAVMDKQTTLWTMHYDRGVLPTPLKSSFTSFTKLLAFVSEYYRRRNILIKEVID